MKTLTRRLFLASAPPALAVGATIAAPVIAEAAACEQPVERVNRLAEELSVAMDAWMTELSEPMAQYGKRAHWIAHVEPASYSGYPVAFENVRARRIVTPEERVRLARAELVAATKALYPEVTDWRFVREDEDEYPESGTVGMFMVLGHKPRKAVRS